MEHVRGVDRQASATLPARLDDWIEADHIVCIIDVWIDRLDLVALGFAHATVGARGRPPYAPAQHRGHVAAVALGARPQDDR
jgi:hypothetical protein